MKASFGETRDWVFVLFLAWKKRRGIVEMMGPRLRDSASWPRGRLHAPYGPPILPSLHVPLLHRHLCSNVKDYLNRDQVVDYKGEKFPRVLAWKMAWDSFFILWKLPLPLGGAGSTRYKRYHSHFRNVAVATLKWKYFSKPLHVLNNQIASFDQLMKLDQSDCLFWTSSEHCGWYKLALISSVDFWVRKSVKIKAL